MNVLFIAVDDLNTVLNCYGASHIISPNIDDLAARGVLFQRAYCQWPVCGPTRASMLTGMTPDGSGIRNLSTQLREYNPDVLTLPQYFRQSGYVTAAAGKVFDRRNVDEGHDSPSWSLPYTKPGNYQYPPQYGNFVKGQWRVTARTATECGPEGVGDDGYVDGQICLDALSKLDGFAATGDPFFLAVGFKKPHIPFIAPKAYWDMYQRDSLGLASFQQPAEGSPDYAYHTPEPTKYVDIPETWTYSDTALGEGILDPDKQRKLLHGYYACVTYIDALVGKLMDKLEETGLADSTIVVLWGDHGYQLGDHNLWGKHTSFEQAVKAPLIIARPGNIPATCPHPVEFVDIYPTLCELAGLEVPAMTQGKSLAGILYGETEAVKPVAVSEYRSGGHSCYSFRTGRYRYTLWFDKSSMRPDAEDWDASRIYEQELYDYRNDSLERVSKAYSLDYKTVRDSLLRLAEAWWDEQRLFFTDPPSTAGSKPVPSYENLVYPNPAAEKIWFQFKSPVRIELIDMAGRIMFTRDGASPPVDVAGIHPGTYLLRLTDEHSHQMARIIID